MTGSNVFPFPFVQEESIQTVTPYQSIMNRGNYYVYITTNPRKTVLYTGVTNDLKVRLRQHYLNRGEKQTFAGKYYCHKLIYFESYSDINRAIEREKEIKDLSRAKKEKLIASENPNWHFLNV